MLDEHYTKAKHVLPQCYGKIPNCGAAVNKYVAKYKVNNTQIDEYKSAIKALHVQRCLIRRLGNAIKRNWPEDIKWVLDRMVDSSLLGNFVIHRVDVQNGQVRGKVTANIGPRKGQLLRFKVVFDYNDQYCDLYLPRRSCSNADFWEQYMFIHNLNRIGSADHKNNIWHKSVDGCHSAELYISNFICLTNYDVLQFSIKLSSAKRQMFKITKRRRL